jgi:ribosome biogenesis GTPase
MRATARGLVVRSTAGFVDVLIGDRVVQCRMRGRLKKAPRTSDICVIGDEVVVDDPDDPSAVVSEVLPRRTRFSRRQPGRGPEREDVLVANLDQLLVTFCYGKPQLKPRLLDRFLVIAEYQRVEPLIVLNKVDLRMPGDDDWRSPYDAVGYRTLSVSAGTGEGVDALAESLQGKISAFVGPSGAGKSSLINRILPDLDLSTASVSDHHGKGRHTTRVASLHALPCGGFLADTPGIRELGTWSLPIDDLDLCFRELVQPRESCAFRRCSHTHEPQCAVIDAVSAGSIARERYESYVRLREEATA